MSRSVALTDRAKAVCAQYWRLLPSGRVAPTCCAGCPLSAPCGTWYPTSWQGIDDHTRGLNAAAEVAP